jgi:hypothetical protein
MHHGKRFVYIFLLLLAVASEAAAQVDSAAAEGWSCDAQLSWYGTPDYSFLMPCLTVTNKHLYLQARYNYEDLATGSFFAGYRFYGGKKLHFELATSAALILGQTRGAAPDLNLQLEWRSWTLSSESEYLFNFEDYNQDYYYQWTDLTFAPLDWLWVGLSAQRTRIYQTGLDLQRGITVGAGKEGSVYVNGYLFNFLNRKEDIFGILSIGLSF